MDNGGEFQREFKEKLDELNIGISNTIPFMPQINSIVERSNGILKRIFNNLMLYTPTKITVNGDNI
jgi:transposase InsO family protein